MFFFWGLNIYAAKAHFSREEVGIIKIFFNACHSLWQRENAGNVSFFEALYGGQFTSSVDDTRLSFFMDRTSELFILSNKGWPREREQENIIECSVHLLYFYLQPGRARRQNHNYILCDDGLNLKEASKTCPFQFEPKCNVEYLSCAWIVNCPGLMGMTFKTKVSAKSYILNNQVYLRRYNNGRWRKVICEPTHLEYSIVCCGYYCKAPKIQSYTSGGGSFDTFNHTLYWVRCESILNRFLPFLYFS